MTDVLGRDCDGRELRAGDRVELIEDAATVPVKAGTLFTVSSWPIMEPNCWLPNRVVLDDGSEHGITCPGDKLRLINSGRELFDKCAREADKMPTESTIRQRMPWTEPEES